LKKKRKKKRKRRYEPQKEKSKNILGVGRKRKKRDQKKHYAKGERLAPRITDSNEDQHRKRNDLVGGGPVASKGEKRETSDHHCGT